jgi:hypothetical protein
MTIKTALVAVTMMAIAAGCGGGDKEASSPSGDAPAATPAAGAGTGNETVDKVVTKAAEVTTCLDLVKQQNWTPAIDACTKASGVDPDNQEVQNALKTAQSGLAAASTADAEKAATDAANKATQDATKGLLNTGK